MDLEIADYERTVEALNNAITEKDKLLEENKAEIDMLEDRVKTLKEQIGKDENFIISKSGIFSRETGFTHTILG